VRFDSVLGSKTFVWAEVAALRIEALDKDAHRAGVGRTRARGLSRRQPARRRAEDVNAERCALVVVGQRELALPLAVIAQITVADGKLRYLSDEVPTSRPARARPSATSSA
jgi:hypothetical protein